MTQPLPLTLERNPVVCAMQDAISTLEAAPVIDAAMLVASYEVQADCADVDPATLTAAANAELAAFFDPLAEDFLGGGIFGRFPVPGHNGLAFKDARLLSPLEVQWNLMRLGDDDPKLSDDVRDAIRALSSLI